MSSKTVVIHQPDFLPYLGFFHRLLYADLYVILDTVQFVTKGKGWHNRDKIKTPQGEKWITISVKKGPLKTKINEVILSKDVNWRQNNLNLIIQNYRKASFFDDIFPHVKKLYFFECQKLVEFNMKSIQMFMELFNLDVETELASKLNPHGKSNELIVDILQKAQATHYLSGDGAKNYYNPSPYKAAGIQVVWQDFKHPVYPQLHGEFIPYLSSVDLLFNCGIKKSREILRSCL